MKPEEFREMSTRAKKYVGDPMRMLLKSTKKRVEELTESLEAHGRFEKWCYHLTNGEISCGFFGSSSAYGFFVRSYRLDPPEPKKVPWLAEVELIVVPELLDRHDLRVNIPTDKPGVFTNTSADLDPPEIAARMLKLGSNVGTGQLDEVLREPCSTCAKPALMVAMDEYYDNDNGSCFVVGRLCRDCLKVEEIANYSETRPNDWQYGLTGGIYRKS